MRIKLTICCEKRRERKERKNRYANYIKVDKKDVYMLMFNGKGKRTVV